MPVGVKTANPRAGDLIWAPESWFLRSGGLAKVITANNSSARDGRPWPM